MQHRAQSFPAVVAHHPRVLILGSMPGIKSLAAGEYYAHPQNVFWKILSDIFAQPVADYAGRLFLIHRQNLSLWDVLQYCERRGSLDAGIDNSTIVVNDFQGFLSNHLTINHIFFNGVKAATEFQKRVWPFLSEDIRGRLKLATLPSTSPAHAGMPYADKRKIWTAVRTALKT